MTRQAKVAVILIAIAVAIGLIAAFVWPTVYREFIAPPATDTTQVSTELCDLGPLEGTGA